MAPESRDHRIHRLVTECLSHTDDALIASSRRMSEARSTTRQLDVAEDGIRQRMAAQRMRLARLDRN
jgi:hypothetical protein